MQTQPQSLPFLSHENVQMMWEVLLSNNTHSGMNDFLKSVFYSQLNSFYRNEKENSTNLLELNKKYLTYIITLMNTHVNANAPTIETTTANTNVNANSKDLITHKDIQDNRMTKFQRDLEARVQDFQSNVQKIIPPEPVFQEKMDTPMGEIDAILKKVIADREREMELFASNSTTSLPPPVETQEKKRLVKIENTNANANEQVLDKNIIDLNETVASLNTQKKISWGTNETREIKSDLEEKDVIVKKMDNMQQQINNLQKHLDTQMEKFNNSLTTIYRVVSSVDKKLDK